MAVSLMDPNPSEDHVLKKVIMNNKHILNRTLQFLLSVSMFGVFVWYSSGFSIHPQSFNAYFSTCLLSMFTHTLERKYMFLICNGILAFVAKTSLSMKSSSDSDEFDQFQPSNILSETNSTVSDMVVVPLEESFESPENVPLIEEYNKEEYSEGDEDQEEGTLCTKTISADEIKEGESESEVAQDDELGETTMTPNEELVNTEELNRKFEEFIRKMKEEIRIEAQRQLITV
ncbi:hypothetical protein Fmac_009329 [Flemingia macrophylla]|uniref:Transmembrane protein n=1 Tax=Flemingia macrophylla TaxID=520843 RepID=A0ABD1MZX9_9FABA